MDDTTPFSGQYHISPRRRVRSQLVPTGRTARAASKSVCFVSSKVVLRPGAQYRSRPPGLAHFRVVVQDVVNSDDTVHPRSVPPDNVGMFLPQQCQRSYGLVLRQRHQALALEGL